MERFEVKRGLVKSMGGNAGLAKMATGYFESIEVDADGVFTGSFGILSMVTAHYTEDGKLQVDVEQERPDFDDPNAMKIAMESRKRWSGFLDEATGYSAKQRGDKAKEAAKKISKSKSAISMARKFMEVSKSVTDEQKATAEELISQIEEKLEEGNGTRALSLSEKLNKLFN